MILVVYIHNSSVCYITLFCALMFRSPKKLDQFPIIPGEGIAQFKVFTNEDDDDELEKPPEEVVDV